MSAAEQLDMFWRLLLALGLGGVIGLEREYRGHEAGVRTNALVCAGAELFGLVSLEYGDSRIAAGVVQGVGFLGAGLIFQQGRDVRGITTAASIWLLAGVGLLVANDLWLIAVLTTAVGFLLLELSPLSDALMRTGSRRRGAPPGEDEDGG